MTAETEALLSHLDTQRTAVREAAARVPGEWLDRRPAPDRWSVLHVLEHLAIVETGIAKLLESRLEADRAAPSAEAVDVTAVVGRFAAAIVDRSRRLISPRGVQPRSDLTAGAAWAALDASRERFRAIVIARDGLGPTAMPVPHPLFGPMNAYEWVVFVGSHEARHAAQIAEIADAATRSEPSA